MIYDGLLVDANLGQNSSKVIETASMNDEVLAAS